MIFHAIIFALVGPGTGAAADGEASASVSAGKASAKADGEARWIKRYAPRARTFELGAFGGVLLPADDIELHRPTLPQKSFRPAAPDLGLRIGYYPMRFFGMEGELALMPTATSDDQGALMYTARAQGVLQLGLWSVTPFILAGGGVLAVSSNESAVGNNADEAFHFGGGLKAYFHRNVGLRIDVRDVVTPRTGDMANVTPDGAAHSIEALIGVSVPLGPWVKKVEPPPPPADRDGDGVPDETDECPTHAGPQDNGCPIPDFDADGIADANDECPCEASAEPNGCPIRDTDGDGIDDPVDKCPNEAGIAPEGCPDPDPDRDGIEGAADGCPGAPETVNGFKDEDGCPDEVPEEVRKFVGVIAGINFQTGKAEIRPSSTKTLDEAVALLTKYDELRVEISGHTDNRGSDEVNRKLSADRAAAVKTYLNAQGIADDRIETRGAGPDEPIGDNKTRNGRAENRRIEFKLLQ